MATVDDSAEQRVSGDSSAAVGIGLMIAALLPFGLGYFFSYLYRATNAVVAPDLVRDIGLTAGELGLLTAAYLLSFSLFQIPLGILLDRFGPRRVQAALVALGALGALLFGLGQSTTSLLIARGIIGIAFSGGLMAAFKAVVLWVPEMRRPLANSLVMSIGALGLLVATAPLEFAVQAIGWRSVYFWLAGVTLLVAAIIFFVVPERQAPPRDTTVADEFREVATISRDRVMIAMMPLLSVSAGSQVAVQTLWAGPWFRDVAGLDRTGVANKLFVMASAFFVGILITGWITDWLTRRGVSLLNVMMGFLALYMVALLGFALELTVLQTPLWLLFSMTGQVSVLAFPWLASYYGAARSARANAGLNLAMFMCAFVLQYAIGMVIDRYPVTPSGGYSREAYQVAFALLLALHGAALTWYAINWRFIAKADAIVRAAYRTRTKS